MWGTARKFKTGERIYFEDAAVISGSCMKYSNDKLWAVFGGKGNWIESQIQSGSWNTAGTIYYFDVPQFEGNDYEFDYVIFTRNGWGIQTYNESPDEYYNYFKLTGYDDSKHVSGEWKKYSVNPMLIGSMNDWNPDASGYTFGDYDGSVCRLIVDLPADETYDFQILHGTGWYSYDNNKSGWTITNTTHESWQTLYSGNQDAHITTGEAGTYIFRYNDSDHTFAAYYPQARFAKQTVLYFDAKDNTDWNNKTYTSKWYFKYWDSGSDIDAEHPEVCNTPVENYKYYVTIPNNDWIGRVQVDRYDGNSRQGGSDVAMAYNRSASTQNCVKAASGSSTSVTWTTYCPPTTSETFADNSTTKISWQPNTNDGSTSANAIWVKTGTTLKVAATASKAVADDNMTIKYDFKVDGTSQQNTTTASYTHSASTNNTTYELSADIYTNYNLDNTKNSTKHTQSSIFYKALDTYSVTHTLSGVTKASGESGTDAAAYYVAYDATYTANAGYYLPSDVTVTIGGVTKTKGTDYTWTVTDGTSGTLNILSNKISGNVVVTINGIWRWSVAGSWKVITPGEGDPYWDPDTYAMGTITKVSSDDVCSVEVTLSANTNYTFKIADRAANPYEYWGNNTSTFYMTYGNSSNWTFGNDASNTAACGLTTAGAGTYTFTYNITQHTVSVTYPESFQVTAAGNPAAGGTVTPSSATYMSTSVGGEITATPNYSHYFNGWTSNAGGTFVTNTATATFKPSATSTVTAAFAERTAFIEGNFQVYNSDRSVRTKTGNAWQDASTTIKMTYDAGNNRYYLHTYSTPTELREQLNDAGAFFYVKTSTSSSSIADAATYKAYSSAAQSLSEYGSSHSLLVTTGESEHGFKFTGSEDGYVIIYFNGTSVWYELECALSYYGGDGATGDAPAARTYYAYGSNQTAAANTYSKTGYSFDHWDTAADDSGSDYAAGATNVAMNAREVCLHAQWTANDYTINLANMEATTAGTESVTVTFDASTNMTASDPITKPTKTHYDFAGYWTSENTGETLDHQLIGADGKWIKDVEGYTSHDGSGNPTWVHDYPISLYAKWTEHEYSITMEVSPAGAGTTSPASTATGKLVTESGNITATPAAGYKFKEWQFSKTDENYDAWCADGYSSTDATIHIKAQHNGTLTAVFEKRYALVGSEYGTSSTKGMPGWEDYTKTFTVNSSSPVDLTYSCTLQAGTTYKFQIHDLADGHNYGAGSDGQYLLLDGASADFTNQDKDVKFEAVVAGEYTFKITAVDGSGHPTVTILRPHQMHMGYVHAEIDNTSAKNTGDTGGTLAASSGGNSVSNNDGFAYNANVTFTASPATGYTATWYTDANYSSEFGEQPSDEWTDYSVTHDESVYVRFIETSTSVTLANDGNGKVQIGGEDKTSTTCGVTTTRELTAVPNEGYKFSSWSKSGDDITLSSSSTNPTTLSGNGSGATSGQTVTANFTYRWALKAESVGWGESEFIIENITTDGSGDVVGYVEISLAANTNYQFTMKDLLTNDIYKNNNAAVQYMTYTNHTDWGFATTYTYNCGITTAGKGTYRFTWNVTDKTMTVTYPTSYQVNYGASVGGSVTSVKDDDNYDVPNGGYVRSGGSVTYTATPNDGYSFAGWYTDNTYGTWFSNTNPWPNNSVSATSNAYAKFTSDNFVIYRTGDMAEDDRAALDDVESYAGGTISEAIEFRMKVRELDKWYSLCLPFTVSAVKVWDEEDGAYYDIVPYYRTGGKFYNGHYIIRTPKQTTDFPIAEFDDWDDPTENAFLPSANTPYIIQWHDSYFTGKYISFFGGTGQDIPSFSAGSAPVSDNVVNVYGNNSMQSGSVAGAYLLDPDYGGGAWLRLDDASASRAIPPFECYLLANSATRALYKAIQRGMVPTVIEAVCTQPSEVRKVMINGQLYIIRGEQIYTIQGTLVK